MKLDEFECMKRSILFMYEMGRGVERKVKGSARESPLPFRTSDKPDSERAPREVHDDTNV